MIMHIPRTLAIVTAATVLACSAHPDDTTAGQPAAEAQPLAPFERLIGRWRLGDSQQEFVWGVGRRSVIARGYFVVDGKPTLVSEGMWFWHPGEERIKGVVTAVNMPVSFFDYTTRFEGDRMVSELASYDADGEASRYVETFEFVDDSQYEWTLHTKSGEDLQKVMGGLYTRSGRSDP